MKEMIFLWISMIFFFILIPSIVSAQEYCKDGELYIYVKDMNGMPKESKIYVKNRGGILQNLTSKTAINQKKGYWFWPSQQNFTLHISLGKELEVDDIVVLTGDYLSFVDKFLAEGYEVWCDLTDWKEGINWDYFNYLKNKSVIFYVECVNESIDYHDVFSKMKIASSNKIAVWTDNPGIVNDSNVDIYTGMWYPFLDPRPEYFGWNETTYNKEEFIERFSYFLWDRRYNFNANKPCYIWIQTFAGGGFNWTYPKYEWLELMLELVQSYPFQGILLFSLENASGIKIYEGLKNHPEQYKLIRYYPYSPYYYGCVSSGEYYEISVYNETREVRVPTGSRKAWYETFYTSCNLNGTSSNGLCDKNCGAFLECDGAVPNTKWCDGYTRKVCNSICEYTEHECRKDAYDSDGGKNYRARGVCYDYQGCSNGECKVISHQDACSGDYVKEYYVYGDFCVYTYYNCKDYGSLYTCSNGRCIQQGGGGCPILKAWNGKEFIEIGKLNIHSNGKDTTYSIVFETKPYEENKYKVILEEKWYALWEGSHIDYVKLVDSKGKECKLIQAKHSKLHNITYLLENSDDLRVDLNPGEKIELIFSNCSGNKFTLLIEGYNPWWRFVKLTLSPFYIQAILLAVSILVLFYVLIKKF